MAVAHRADDLIRLFNELFSEEYRCQLVCGQHEPLYRPTTDPGAFHRLEFAHGFFASALHEVAHWCIAGEQRRRQVDFGYWYLPERDPMQQAEFEAVEVAPQVLESVFSDAAGFKFRPSLDNLELRPDPAEFLAKVKQAKAERLAAGLPTRAAQFHRALTDFYDVAESALP